MTYRANFTLLLLFACGGIAARADSLYEGFRNPDSRYSPMPIWYWNAEIQPEEAKRQIDEYIRQGAQGAIVYPGVGLGTRFLSEEWWQLWAQMLPYARDRGFKLGWVPDFNHPQGDARDVWMDPPDQSRVLIGHPDFRMKRLSTVEKEFTGPGTAKFEGLPNPSVAVAARKTGAETLEAGSLRDMSVSIRGSGFQAELGEGNWLLVFYYPELTEGNTHRQVRVDPLNRDATLRYIDVTLGEFYRRFKEYVGSTLTVVLLDSEGSFGGPIVSTPAFFDAFQAKKKYDFRKHLPLLKYDGGNITAKIRNDYFEVVSDMFVENFWKPVADWSTAHGVVMAGQSFGDTLQFDPAISGDFMAVMRSLTLPSLENGADAFREPRQFKEVASIAHFEKKRFWCECQLLQGLGSFISPEKMRYGANAIAAFGVNLWSQNTSYDETHPEWPPSMGRGQPHWKFFHRYSELVRRFSYMNGGGSHVADVLMFRPISTVFAYASPVFGGARRARRNRPEFEEPIGQTYMVWEGDFSSQVERDYHGLMNRLTVQHNDFDVADDHYLKQAAVERGSLRLGDETFGVLVLPPMKVIQRSSIEKIREFYESGGLVIAFGSLPAGSTEQGWKDPEVSATVKSIFGVPPDWERDAENRNGRGGRSFFIAQGRQRVGELIDRLRPVDFKVIEGAADHLFQLHRRIDDRDIFWVANDTEFPRNVVVSLLAKGKPELWNPADGTRRETAYWVKEGRTIVPLELTAWDGAYIVFSPSEREPRTSVAKTNLRQYAISETDQGVRLRGKIPAVVEKAYAEGLVGGKPFRVETVNPSPARPQALSSTGWKFRPVADRVQVHFAREMVAQESEGRELEFTDPNSSDDFWNLQSLSRERWTIRDWNVIGPFPNPDHQGFGTAYPPEQAIDLDARYEGINGEPVAWRRYRPNAPAISGGGFLGGSSSAELAVNLTGALSIPNVEGVEYALTYVYAPNEARAQAILAAENAKLFVNGELVFQMHPMPRYYEYRDAFAFRPAISLKAGWNQILVKIEHCPTPYYRGRPIIFSLRLADADGLPLEGLVAAISPEDPKAPLLGTAERQDLERWYRIPIPPGTKAFLVPARPAIRAIYLNGAEVKASAGGRVSYQGLDWSRPNVLTLRMAARDELLDWAEFETGDSQYRLGSWTRTGLSHYSGEAVYETTFVADPGLSGKRVELDCGQVGLTAEVWLNGHRIGERAWRPFVFDVTEHLRAGENHLRIAVTNSDSNSRSEPDQAHYEERSKLQQSSKSAVSYIDSIGPSGLLGPVRLVPYVDVELGVTP